MPALPTITTDFLTKIKNELSVGPDTSTPGSGNTNAAAQNYLRAQDMASVLELLQDALDQPSDLTVVSGSTTTIVDGASTFVAGAQVGNFVTFDAATTTAALQGLSFKVLANTTTTLTVELMPAAAATGDLYTIQAAFMDSAISELREGQGLADAPRGSVYGEARIVADALNRLTLQTGGTQTERNIGSPSLTALVGTSTTVINLDTLGTTYRIDEFRGLKIVVDSGEPRTIVSNNENSVTLNAPLSTGAPSGGESVVMTMPADSANPTYGKTVTHAGPQAGENMYLAELINQAQVAVAAFTLPT